MRILQDGNVGIGTASPQDELHISSVGEVGLYMSDSTAGTDVKNIRLRNEAGYFHIERVNDGYTVANTRLSINNSTGAVGIGVTSASAKLDINDGHIASTQTTAPTGTTGTCTSDSVSGTDTKGVITGTCNNQTLIVAFNMSYTTAPACVVSATNAAAAAGARESYTTSTSALTITVPGNISAGTWSYICMQ